MQEKERGERLTKVFALLMKRGEGKIPTEEIKLEIIYKDSIAIAEPYTLEVTTS